MVDVPNTLVENYEAENEGAEIKNYYILWSSSASGNEVKVVHVISAFQDVDMDEALVKLIPELRRQHGNGWLKVTKQFMPWMGADAVEKHGLLHEGEPTEDLDRVVE